MKILNNKLHIVVWQRVSQCSDVTHLRIRAARGRSNNFWGLKTEKSRKIAISAYSSELITPERQRISQRLKRLWNHKTMAYKVYVRP